MKRVLKYLLPAPGAPGVEFRAPGDLTAVSVGLDGAGEPCLWAVVTPEEPHRGWRLRTVGTGWDIEEGWVAGTFVEPSVGLVWHAVVIPS